MDVTISKENTGRISQRWREIPFLGHQHIKNESYIYIVFIYIYIYINIFKYIHIFKYIYLYIHAKMIIVLYM